MNRNTPRSTAPRSSSSFAAGGAKKVQKSTPAASADGWQTTTPVKGGARVVHTPEAPKKASTARFPASRFSAFDTDSDEEDHPIIPAETPQEFFSRLLLGDPVLAAVARGVSWFEAENGEDDPAIKASMARIQAGREAREAREAARLAAEEAEAAIPKTDEEQEESYMSHCSSTEEEFWGQSFTDNLEERIPDYFDTSALTDSEFHALLSWTYSKGWIVDICGRDSVKLVSDDGPSRRYIADDFWSVRAERGACCSHSHSHSHSNSNKKAKTSTIPRFCRAAVCEEADCRYVHEDTIPKTNRPCGFGETCGASDPTGVKRSQCLFMHPGETWTTESCIHKPAPKAAE